MWPDSFPVAAHNVQGSSLKIKGVKECRPLEPAIEIAYWEGHLISALTLQAREGWDGIKYLRE